jgi:glycosyltransferase involved in cell wall biosynthesis
VYDEIQTVSEGVRQYTLKRDKTEPARTVTILNGIDPSVMVPPEHVKRIRASLDLPPGAPIIITVANPRHVKGIDVLVRAAVKVGSEIPDARILVVGNFGGSETDKTFTKGIMHLTETLGAGRWIKFLGTSHVVPTLLKASDVFVLPSRSEGLSNALLESMRAGLPCVATAVGGNPEVVVEGRTGFLVPSDDPAALADRILRLLRDRELRVRMGEASRQRLIETFTVQKMTDQVVASYQRTLAEKGIRVDVPKLQVATAGCGVTSSV